MNNAFFMSLNKTVRDIKKLKIQGATAVAREAIKALADYGQTIRKSGHGFIIEAEKAAATLAITRPTEPLMHNGLAFLISSLRQSQRQQPAELQAILNKTAADYLSLIDQAEQVIITRGEKLIKKGFKVFTHCHSSLAEKVLLAAWQERYFQVFNTETRPLLQGRITAINLLKHGLPVTMVADSAADFLISHHSGKELAMDMVIIGADSLSHQGDVYNKIGSYGIALAAWEAHIPLYITSTALKMDADNKIQVELRDESELWPDRPRQLEILNFAFDMIPAKFITGIICEFGIVKPGLLKVKVAKEYPWLIKE